MDWGAFFWGGSDDLWDHYLERFPDGVMPIEVYDQLFLHAAQDLVICGRSDILRMLLESQVAIPVSGEQQATWLTDFTINRQMFTLTMLLRKHGAALSKTVADAITKILSGHPDRYFFPVEWRNVSRDRWLYIKSPPASERAPAPFYHRYEGHSFGDVIQSWPPPNLPKWPSGCKITKIVHGYWECVANERRREAKLRVPRNWRKVRSWAKVRFIAMFWLGKTQERLCAPGGTGRAADLKAYRKEF